MPVYEYFCPKCEKEFELMRPISQSGESAECPACGAKSEKLVSVFASKENYTIKVPAGAAYRGRERSASKPSSTKKK